MGYRNISTIEGNADSNIGSFDIMIGGTFFPRKPSFVFLGMPVRLKASLLGGMGISNETTIYSACVSLAMVFSSGNDPSGMTVGLAYWPSVSAGSVRLPGSVCASVGFLFAPSAQ